MKTIVNNEHLKVYLWKMHMNKVKLTDSTSLDHFLIYRHI